MPTESPIAVESTSTAAETTDATYEIDTVGVEFEYPTTGNPDAAPAVEGENSRQLYNDARSDNNREWPVSPDEIPMGAMTSDHVGAEITSAQMDLHTTQPEAWYVGSIQRATEYGYPFAATGYGDTVFGMHIHMSELPRYKAEGLLEVSQEPWFRTFICSSVGPGTADPWRHGGISVSDLNGQRDFESQRCVNARINGDNHYEWRLPEPVMPDHFEMVMHFLRTLEIDGVDAAREYARERVEAADDRLTAVQQFRAYRERIDGYVEVVQADANDHDNNQMDREAAQFLIDLMEGT